jgi:hypothetical protein
LLRLDLNLYKSVEEIRTLAAGEDVEWSFKLPVNHGSISVTSRPKGVPITLDNKPSGHSTPHTFTRLRAGTHEIELSKPGHGVQRQRVVIVPGETALQEFDLEARLGTVSVSSTTADGTPCRGLVFVDDKSTGKRTPLREKLVAIDHTIKVDCDGRVGVRKVEVLHNTEVEVPIVVESFTKQHFIDAQKALAKSRMIDRIGFSAGGAAVAVTGWSAWTSYVAQTDANAITSILAGDQYQILLGRRNTFAATAVAASVVGTSMITAAIFHRLRVTSKRKLRVEYVEEMTN